MYLNIFFCSLLLCNFFTYANKDWMIEIKNLKELNQNIENKYHQEYLKASCKVQLQKNKIPWACYEWIYQKKPEEEIKQSLTTYFNEKCQTSSVRSNELKQIHKALQNQYLSAFCRQILQEKKQIIEYQLRDMAPDFLFKWYFKKEL